MLSPIIRRLKKNDPRAKERGVTIALVAAAMVAIISMAALSIDIGTLYQAKAEAQRAADAGALAAARVISISGITGDPNNVGLSWQPACGGANSTATLAAIAIAQAQQNFVGRAPAGTVTVTYGAGSAGGSSASCVGVANFGVNPVINVTVRQANLPVFFARVFSLVGGSFSSSSVSATATAEVFNPSGSGSLASGMVPVQPRCVKPWIVPNSDPQHLTAGGFVSATGTILSQGIQPIGVIGENFNMNADCNNTTATCFPLFPNPSGPTSVPGALQYVPALVSGSAGAVPSCATAGYQAAIAGCDQTTVYACGTPLGGQVDLTENPIKPTAATGDTSTAVQCLTNSSVGGPGGADVLTTLTYPFQIQAGSSNPLVQQGIVNSGDFITASNSIVTIPIYNGSPLAGLQPQVTIIGFLQVFINQVNGDGSLGVTVMNVSGCSNSAAGNPTVTGTSPVPVRLITAP